MNFMQATFVMIYSSTIESSEPLPGSFKLGTTVRKIYCQLKMACLGKVIGNKRIFPVNHKTSVPSLNALQYNYSFNIN